MKPHTSPRDWMKFGCGCHDVQPSARAIFEALGTVRNVRGIAAVQEGGQISLWSGTACQTPNNPSNSCQGIWVILYT